MEAMNLALKYADRLFTAAERIKAAGQMYAQRK